MSAISKIWNQKDDWFRDHAQADTVGSVIISRLADDRIEEECRYLMRLKWHFHMGYQEVSYDELQQYVSESKMALLDELFAEIAAHNYTGIDEWIERCEKELPTIEDKYVSMYRNSTLED